MSAASALVLVAGLAVSMLSVGLVAAAPANAGSGYESSTAERACGLT